MRKYFTDVLPQRPALCSVIGSRLKQETVETPRSITLFFISLTIGPWEPQASAENNELLRYRTSFCVTTLRKSSKERARDQRLLLHCFQEVCCSFLRDGYKGHVFLQRLWTCVHHAHETTRPFRALGEPTLRLFLDGELHDMLVPSCSNFRRQNRSSGRSSQVDTERWALRSLLTTTQKLGASGTRQSTTSKVFRRFVRGLG